MAEQAASYSLRGLVLVDRHEPTLNCSALVIETLMGVAAMFIFLIPGGRQQNPKAKYANRCMQLTATLNAVPLLLLALHEKGAAIEQRFFRVMAIVMSTVAFVGIIAC